jgi:hypothetical protein
MAASLENKTLESVLSGMPTFQPIAYYDKHLDVIRVQVLDCSITEERFDRIMTIYHNNQHPAPNGVNDIVGFAIKGIRHLLHKLGMKSDGAILIADLLDNLVKAYPTLATKRIIEFYKELGTSAPKTAEVKLAA